MHKQTKKWKKYNYFGRRKPFIAVTISLIHTVWMKYFFLSIFWCPWVYPFMNIWSLTVAFFNYFLASQTHRDMNTNCFLNTNCFDTNKKFLTFLLRPYWESDIWDICFQSDYVDTDKPFFALKKMRSEHLSLKLSHRQKHENQNFFSGIW